MKNFYLFILTFFCIYGMNAQFTESFESGIPSTWTVINNGDNNTWIQGIPTDENGVAVAVQDGTQAAIINFSFTAGHDDYLVSPAIAITSGTNGFASFWARNASDQLTDLFDVKISTTGTAEADFTTTLASNITPPTDWTKYEYNLNAYNGQTIYFAIHSKSVQNNQQLAIDLFENNSGPVCPTVSNINTTENLGNSITLEWTNGNTETSWDIEYGITGFTPTGTPTTTANSNPFTINGLTPETTYDFYIRADCDGDGTSTWAGPYSVTTIFNYCGATFVDSGGETGDYSNNENITTVINPTAAGQRVRVTFTSFDIENNFDYLKIYDGPDNTFPALHTGNGFTGTTNPGTFFSTHSSGSLTFVFTSDFIVSSEGWVANVICEDIPTCLDITELGASSITGETAILNWTAPANQTSWIIEYGPTGFALGSGTQITTTTNSYELTGLNPVTTYDFYVQGVCSPTDSSPFAGPNTFETGCSTFIPEYIETFSTWLPDCWEEASDGTPTTGPTGFGLGDWNQDGMINNGFIGAAKINLWNLGTSDWLISPSIDLGDGSINYELKYDVAATNFGGTNQTTLGSDDEVQVLITTDGGTTWVNLETYNEANTPSNTISSNIIDLSTYTGVVRIAFWGTEGTVDDTADVDFFIDNFTVREIPTCNEVSNLASTNLTDTQVDLSWDSNGTETEWEVEYGPSGFAIGTGTIVSATTNPFTLTGLSPITSYDIYVRAVCSSTDISPTAGPLAIETPCSSFIPEYLEDFANWLPDCWEEASDGTPTTGPTGFGSGDWVSDGMINDGFTGAAKINIWNQGSSDWLISPIIDLGDGSIGYELRYNVAATNFGGANQTVLGSDDQVQVLITTDGGATWINLETYDATNTPSNVPTVTIFNLSAYTGIVQIAFWGTEGDVDDPADVDFFIDDFNVRVLPTCPQPTNISISNITTTSADITWIGDDGASEYEIIYVEAGGDPATGSTLSPNPTTAMATLTGLLHSTPYDIYITAICSAADISIQSGPISFTTRIPNDDCENAVLLTSSPIGEACSTSVNGTVNLAQPTTDLAACNGNADNDVWFKFEAISNNQKITLSNLEGDVIDMVTEVFSGDCDNLVSILCSDPNITEVSGLTVGETYYIRVHTFNGSQTNTTFTICVTALAPLADNDACSTATVVESIPYSNNQSNYVSTNNDGFIENCAGGSNDGVWYQVTGNGGDITVTVTPYNGFNCEVGIYSSPCGTADPTVVGCASSAGTNGEESTTFTSEEGVTYYINIGHISNSFNFPEGDFDIEIITEVAGVEDLISSNLSNVLYPNPTNGKLFVKADKDIKSVIAYDMNGSLVSNRLVIENNSFDISNYQEGIYIFKITFVDGTTENHKVIKK